MKIIYMADIHGAFAEVKELLDATDAQVYIIAGDLIDRPFYTEEMAARYRRLETYFCDLQCRQGDDTQDLDDFVDMLTKRTDLSDDIMERVKEYREATIRARRGLQQKYKVLESILFLKSNARTLCLPGNYDMDLQYTSLHGRDLHRHWYHVADLRIAGYGGADVTTPGIPRRYTVPYNADRGMSEMTRFFTETTPDIIVTHKPAQGIHDHVSPMGESGSPELRRFCEENQVLLCLTGHIHDQWGFVTLDGTVYLNPSNFGTVPQPGGHIAEGGFFFSIDTRERHMTTITLSKLVRGRVHDLQVHKSADGRWDQEVRDPERFGALLRGKNFDRLEEPEKRLPRNELKRKMQQFFPDGGTSKTIEAASREISSVASQIAERYGAGVAVDILGGTNPTPSRPSTTLDAVLYLTCGTPVPDTPTEDADCPRCLEILGAIQSALVSAPHIRIIDWIDLHRVVRSMQERNYECSVAQRFVAYRTISRPVLGDAAAVVDHQLDIDRTFRSEIEGTGCAYLEIFQNLARRIKNMKVFEARLRELGIVAPPAFKQKIGAHFHGHNETQGQKIDQIG